MPVTTLRHSPPAYTDETDIALMAKLDSTMSDSVSTRCAGQSNDHGKFERETFWPSRSRVSDAMLARPRRPDRHPPRRSPQQAVKNDNESVERFVHVMAPVAAHYSNRDPEKSSSRL